MEFYFRDSKYIYFRDFFKIEIVKKKGVIWKIENYKERNFFFFFVF